jgi:hypothetical protein
MSDGSILKGAQGNFPFDRSLACGYRASAASAQGPALTLSDGRNIERSLYAVPWVQPDPLVRLDQMSLDEIASRREAIPPGVLGRHRSNTLYPVQVPDLIGVKDRHYLDRTGLQQHP